MKPNEREDLIYAWREAASELETLKNEEHTLRLRIYREIFDNSEKIGVHNHKLGDCYTLKLTNKLNISIDKSKVQDILENIPESNRNVFRFTPELDARIYNSLPENIQRLVNRALTTKLAIPTLRIVEPRKKEGEE